MKRWGSALKLWQPVGRRWGRPGLLLVTVLTVLVLAGGGVLALLRLNTPGGGALGWYNAAWPYRVKLTIKHGNVDEPLSNFPVYVDMADLPDTFFGHVQANGGDIRITTADGATEVAREVAAIDSSGKTGELYFKAPILSSTTDNSFYIYYGNSGATAYTATDTYGTHAVWSNGYTQVYHLDEDPGSTAPQIVDSTGNGGDGTANGTMTSGDVVAGKVGSAINFDGVDDYISLGGAIPIGPSTFSVWEKSSSSAKMGMVGKLSYWTDAYGYGMYMQNNAIKALAFSAYSGVGPLATPAVDGNWHSGTFTLDNWGAGTNGKLYLDGSLSASGSGPASYYSSYQYTIGSGHTSQYFFLGSLDEIRASSVERSAGWISTAYRNQNLPAGFYTVDAQPLHAATGEKGLVAWWKLDGNAKDSTPYGHDGTLTNSPVATVDRKGSTGKALAFNNLNSLVLVPDAEDLKYRGGNLSVTSWIYVDPTETTGGGIVTKTWNNTGSYNYRIALDATNHIVVVVSGATVWSFTSNAAVAAGTWTQVVLTLDSSNNVKLYLNGQLDKSAVSTISDWTPPSDLNLPLAIGVTYPFTQGWAGSAAADFGGSIDDMRVYNRVLSADDITAQYNSYDAQLQLYRPTGSRPDVNLTAGLVGHWLFNGNAKDSTPYSHNGTVNGATLVADRKGRLDSAYSLDGTGDITINNPLNQAATDEVWTVNAWVNLPASSPSASQYLVNGMNQGLYANYSTANRTILYLNAGTDDYYEYGTSSLRDGNWHMLTFVFRNSDGYKKIYVDGVDDSAYGPNKTNTPFGLSSTFQIGTSLTGSLDDVRIYNRVLSDDEVAALYLAYE